MNGAGERSRRPRRLRRTLVGGSLVAAGAYLALCLPRAAYYERIEAFLARYVPSAPGER